MSDFHRCSRQELAERRRQLRRRRRLQFLQSLWRTAALCGLAVGSVMVATSPRWQVQTAQQIDLSGNQLLSDQAIYEMLPIDYPQPLLKIQPQALKARLLKSGPIADAMVSRRLFPPGLNIRIQERRPVAIALPNTAIPVASLKEMNRFSQRGLLDESGFWMPYNSFTELNQGFQPPTLEVYGMRAAYQADWPKLYQKIHQSPVQITAIDWREPSNLVLHTELGMVHIGPYSQAFSQQLATLDRMRNLNAELNSAKIAFIDLRNPSNPNVEILQATKTP